MCDGSPVMEIAGQDEAVGATPSNADPVETFRSIYPSLLATGRRLTRSKAEAEDLVQEAILRTLAHHRDFEGIDDPGGYVRTVVFRLAFKRRVRRWVEVPLDEQVQLADDRTPDDQRASLIDTLDHVPTGQRACLMLRYLYGFDDQNIAALLGCRTSTVRSQIARGLTRMRAEMEVEDADPNP